MTVACPILGSQCSVLSTQFLSTQFLSTQFLSTQFLSTQFLSTQFLSTQFLSTQYLSTQFLNTQFLHSVPSNLVPTSELLNTLGTGVRRFSRIAEHRSVILKLADLQRIGSQRDHRQVPRRMRCQV